MAAVNASTSTTTDAATAAALLNKSSSSKTDANAAAAASERFLKLLVTQLQNQDPMNPVDNAQMTSQMAQISTVSGIEKLNTTVEGLNSQFVSMQAVQGAALVGKSVLLPGDKLSIAGSATGNVATGTFDVPAAVDRVKVEVLSPAGRVVDTLNLGAMGAGRNEFTWPGGKGATEADGYRFRVTASSGTTTVASTALMHDTVEAVNTGGSQLTLELARSGPVPYSKITAVD